MTLQPQPILPVPEATAAVARAAFPNGNVYLQLRDELGTVYDDTLFTHLYPRHGQPHRGRPSVLSTNVRDQR